MSIRIKKLKDEYEHNANKIACLQDKNKKLAERIRQLENDEIIGAVRNSGLSIDEFLILLGKNTVPEIKKDLEEEKDEI